MFTYENPVYYTSEQQLVEDYIRCQFGETESGYIAHEITSQYVHTDVLIATVENEPVNLVTLGMGARKMEAPDDSLARTELTMVTSKEPSLSELSVITSELVSLSKFPFRHHTWFGANHTMFASPEFARQFGYSHFVFVPTCEPVALSGQEQVNFLLAIPIYERERDWLMENDPFDFYDLYFDTFDESRAFCADLPRDPIV